MSLMSLYIDGAERSCGAKILASTTTDTTLNVDDWDTWRTPVTFFRRNHLDGSCGTTACTMAAMCSIGIGDAILHYQYRMTDLG